MKPTTVDDCSVLELPKIENPAGRITPIHSAGEVPFDIARVYYLYDVPGGATRGGHAHKGLQQLIVAASGSFDVILDDGTSRRTVHLNRPYLGLLMPRMIWRELVNFSSGGTCLVLASRRYDAADYIRNYDEFLQLKKKVTDGRR
jgi:WxcM-like, C-terminal